MDFVGKKIIVVGLGKSGSSVSRWLAERGASVKVSEVRHLSELDRELVRDLAALGVELETGSHREETFLGADLIIVSPGVPPDLGPLRLARGRGIPVICEMGLAATLIDIPIVAITGTNGKSTTTSLIGSIFREAGISVFVGGNIGTPLIECLSEGKGADYAVIEVSSFQLDTMDDFAPHVSILLNITPDHLDRYRDFDAYVRSKLKICKNQGPDDLAIINDDDPILSRVGPGSVAAVLRFGMGKGENRHAYLEDEGVTVRLGGSKGQHFRLDNFRLPGRHNLENLMASLLCATALGIDPEKIQHAIDHFKGLSHRLEFVREIEGRAFYDDSKATNVSAAVESISSFDRPVILIAGGRDKGGEYSSLVRAAERRVRRAILLGESRELLARSLEGSVPYDMADTMEDAVSRAFDSSREGDVVLLAPACSSFDMFKDYSHRGRVYREAVERLSNGR
ncbi:MAG: UDP-N-acetylmuramoyl-L-alanine--D-glutamate ligase [Deltaproteobacteria bacterium]|nr:UDP-N-acetylmuramoyl-L-alanine--D-glutamate ligase [Deltaproteobacteria bacterium]MBW2136575.1 UDP-N-acetylmuramoyl-L-alanine--D-glutamate ligase [Deltaproteobacteria bacterium]